MRATAALKVLFCLSVLSCQAKKTKDGEKPAWTKKDVKDYTDEDLQRLLAQWEEDEEPIPPDELPEGHPDRPIPPVDFSKLDMNNQEQVLAATKKGKTIMLFAKINKFKDRQETEEVSSLWHTGLYNAHIHGERFLVEDMRVMFSFKDGKIFFLKYKYAYLWCIFYSGSYAWEAKDFLIEQERVEDVQLEGKTFKGKFAEFPDKEDAKPKKEKKKEKKKKKKVKKEELWLSIANSHTCVLLS